MIIGMFHQSLRSVVVPARGRLLPSRGIRSTCMAVVLPRYGGPEVLEVRHDQPVPVCAPHEVLVRVRAAAVNPLDVKMRSGYGSSLFQSLLPLVLGRDASGTVAAVGCSVDSHRVGDEVFGALHPTAARGTYSEYALFAQDQLKPKPPSLSFADVAAIPFAALTAWRALRSMAGVKRGQRLAVLGGGGAVGLSAIQLAAAAGADVACTCGMRSMERVKAAGATCVVDYTTAESDDLKCQFKGQFDAVLDTIGMEETEEAGVEMLKPGGHYMTLQGEVVKLADLYGLVLGGARAAANLLQKQLLYKNSHGIEYHWVVMRTDVEALEEIALLVNEGRLKLPVEKMLPMDRAAEAHTLIERKESYGKLVLTLS